MKLTWKNRWNTNIGGWHKVKNLILEFIPLNVGLVLPTELTQDLDNVMYSMMAVKVIIVMYGNSHKSHIVIPWSNIRNSIDTQDFDTSTTSV